MLLENNDYYEKLATMLCTGDIASVKQAIELAESMGYAHNVEYETTPIRTTYHSKQDRIVHRWGFSVPRPFFAIIMTEWKKRKTFDTAFVVYQKHNHSIGIKITETL